jgi:hypothetical protein
MVMRKVVGRCGYTAALKIARRGNQHGFQLADRARNQRRIDNMSAANGEVIAVGNEIRHPVVKIHFYRNTRVARPQPRQHRE